MYVNLHLGFYKESHMNFFQYFMFLLKELRSLSREVGYTSWQMYIAFARAYIRIRPEFEEFKVLQLYKYSGPEISRYLTMKQLPSLQKILNAGATAQEKATLYNKQSFNHTFREFIHRDWIYLPDSSEEVIRAFFTRNERSLLKPVGGCQGDGILLLNTSELDVDAFLREHRNDDSILEAFILQHPAMAQLNPSSVNTVRIITARRNGRVHMVGAAIRCGGADSYVDNFHSGGAAFPLDIDTGIVSGPGRSLTSKAPIFHSPATGTIVTGFEVPHWNKLLKVVTKAALLPEHLGYLAWDIAITPDGVDFVEVNVTTPGATVIQLNGPAYGKLKEFMHN